MLIYVPDRVDQPFSQPFKKPEVKTAICFMSTEETQTNHNL
jgi:hypothetical protein